MKLFYPKRTDLILIVYLIMLAFTCYDDLRISENKNKPKAAAFNKTIEGMYNNKYIRRFIKSE